MKKALLYLLSKIDRQTASEWRGLIEARKTKPLDKQVEFAFSCPDEHGNERRFYMFSNPLDRPPKRQTNWQLRMVELETGATRETMQQFVQEMTDILNASKGSISLQKLNLLVHAIGERLNLAPFEDQLWTMASLEFFELHEDLTDYNIAQNDAKIAMWKAHLEADAFFLQPVVKGRMPYIERFEAGLATQIKMAELELRRQQKLFPFLARE